MGAVGDWRLFFLQRDRWRRCTPADVQRVALAVPEARQPHGRRSSCRREARPRAEAPARRRRRAGEGLQGRRGGRRRRGLRRRRRPTSSAHAARQLANGMKVALLPKKTRGETVSSSAAARSGDEKSLARQVAAARLSAAMLTRGTREAHRGRRSRTRSTTCAPSRLRRRRARQVTSRPDPARRNLPDTLRLVAEMLREPAFPPSEFEQLERERATGSRARAPIRTSPRARAPARQPVSAGDPRYVPTIDEEIAGSTQSRSTT